MKITVTGKQATITERETLTTGSQGIMIDLEFSPEWDGLAKTAQFYDGEKVIDILMVSDSVLLPWEMTKTAGATPTIVLIGKDGKGVVKASVECPLGQVWYGIRQGTDPEPTPDWKAQVEAAISTNITNIGKNADAIVQQGRDIQNLRDSKQDKLIGKPWEVVSYGADGKPENVTMEAAYMGGGLWISADSADANPKTLLNTATLPVGWREALLPETSPEKKQQLLTPDPKKLESLPLPGQGTPFPLLLAGGSSLEAWDVIFFNDPDKKHYPVSISSGGPLPEITVPEEAVGTMLMAVFADGKVQLVNPPVTVDFSDLQPKDFVVYVTDSGDGGFVTKDKDGKEATYRQAEFAILDGKTVKLLYKGVHFRLSSQSLGSPSPFYRFKEDTRISSGVAEQRTFVWSPSGLGAVLTMETHTTLGNKVLSVTVSGSSGSYTASKKSMEIADFCNPEKNAGLSVLYYPGGGTNPDEILRYTGYDGRAKEAVFTKPFPSGRVLFAYVGETGSIRTQWFTPPTGVKFLVTKNDPPDGRFKSSTWANIKKWAAATAQVWYNTEIDGVDLLKKDDVVWMPLLAQDDPYVPDRLVYIVGEVTAADASSCAITGHGVINDAGGLQDALSQMVRVTPQTLTPAQQEQARENINAAKSSEWRIICDDTLPSDMIFERDVDKDGKTFAIRAFRIHITRPTNASDSDTVRTLVSVKSAENPAYRLFMGGISAPSNKSGMDGFLAEIKGNWACYVANATPGNNYGFEPMRTAPFFCESGALNDNPITGIRIARGNAGAFPAGTNIKIWGCNA